MTHTASFNAGIEAACRRMAAEAIRLHKQGLEDVAKRMLAEVGHIALALKRPEPSEDDVLKVAQAIRQQIPDAEPIAIEAAARAALKAMEGE